MAIISLIWEEYNLNHFHEKGENLLLKSTKIETVLNYML